MVWSKGIRKLLILNYGYTQYILYDLLLKQFFIKIQYFLFVLKDKVALLTLFFRKSIKLSSIPCYDLILS